VIVGGLAGGEESQSARKAYARALVDVFFAKRPLKSSKELEMVITFTKEGAHRLKHPHNNALVVTMLITNFTTKRVLMDNRSSSNILYYLALKQMGIEQSQLKPFKGPLKPFKGPLVGFIGDQVYPLGSMSLLVTAGAYNAISRRPALNKFNAITSIYHMMMKFPSTQGRSGDS
jgi:hypothetical protein